ncbi:MAG: hypothetical protein KKF44_10140, partial [Nanoarchaeota archaeon]|nr:hypothetical protein [Nanoarchaeota archaeon]
MPKRKRKSKQLVEVDLYSGENYIREKLVAPGSLEVWTIVDGEKKQVFRKRLRDVNELECILLDKSSPLKKAAEKNIVITPEWIRDALYSYNSSYKEIIDTFHIDVDGTYIPKLGYMIY